MHIASLALALGSFPLSALILGIIDIAIIAAVLILVGLLIVWIALGCT